jgi:hypothetical protein
MCGGGPVCICRLCARGSAQPAGARVEKPASLRLRSYGPAASYPLDRACRCSGVICAVGGGPLVVCWRCRSHVALAEALGAANHGWPAAPAGPPYSARRAHVLIATSLAGRRPPLAASLEPGGRLPARTVPCFTVAPERQPDHTAAASRTACLLQSLLVLLPVDVWSRLDTQMECATVASNAAKKRSKCTQQREAPPSWTHQASFHAPCGYTAPLLPCRALTSRRAWASRAAGLAV